VPTACLTDVRQPSDALERTHQYGRFGCCCGPAARKRTLEQPAGPCRSTWVCCAHSGTCHRMHSCLAGSTCTPAQRSEQGQEPCKVQAYISTKQHCLGSLLPCAPDQALPVMSHPAYCVKSDIDRRSGRRLAGSTCTRRCRHSKRQRADVQRQQVTISLLITYWRSNNQQLCCRRCCPCCHAMQ
jgi:hypothetical protein